jgi:hypothetical protein
MKNIHRKLLELKDYLQNNSLGEIHLTNLPQHFWETLGECISESKPIQIEKEKIEEIIDQIESEDPYCGLENIDKAVSDLVNYLKENKIDVI